MINVQTKATKKPVDVYDVKRDKNGYPHFLVYKDGQWVYLTAKLFEPYWYEYEMDGSNEQK